MPDSQLALVSASAVPVDRRFSIAPMMGHTDQNFRWLIRQFCPHILLFTEMVTCKAVIHAPPLLRKQRLLAYEDAEGAVVLQMAASEPSDMAQAAALVEQEGEQDGHFVELNINAGCPSKRATCGNFGAVLMRQPQKVADLVRAARDHCSLPVTVKTRLGVDEQDSDDELAHFIDTVAQAGCRTFYLHARKAWLNGINPAQNRNLPPLDYERVRSMQRQFPELEFIINGGIRTWQQARELLPTFSGVMVGRGAYINLGLLLQADQWLANSLDAQQPQASSDCYHNLVEVLPTRIIDRLQSIQGNQRAMRALLRHLPPLFRSIPGARSWRRSLSVTHSSLDQSIELLPKLPWQEIVERAAPVAA
ncbi:MAG: tRNA dihydrouridine(20/20a) synthase DusA [Gammaproteobacteria bacterium]